MRISINDTHVSIFIPLVKCFLTNPNPTVGRFDQLRRKQSSSEIIVIKIILSIVAVIGTLGQKRACDNGIQTAGKH